MKKITVYRIITAVLILLLMGTIFYFSAQEAVESDKTSNGFIAVLCKMPFFRFSSLSIEEQAEKAKSLSFVVRKAAHLAEFAALGFLCSLFAVSYGFKFFFFALGYGTAVFYAATDEFHQLFVEGRSAQLSDVCVDAVGALFGVIAAWLVCLASKKLIKRKNRRKS